MPLATTAIAVETTPCQVWPIVTNNSYSCWNSCSNSLQLWPTTAIAVETTPCNCDQQHNLNCNSKLLQFVWVTISSSKLLLIVTVANSCSKLQLFATRGVLQATASCCLQNTAFAWQQQAAAKQMQGCKLSNSKLLLNLHSCKQQQQAVAACS